MVTIRWCTQQNKGIQVVLPNENMSYSYLGMAEESIVALKGLEQSNIWTAATTYYIYYYSLYALMLRMGVKCEIHACSLEFMKLFLVDFYNEKDREMIEKAFSARIDLQYYANRPVDKIIIEETKLYCKDFYLKTKDVIARITETTIESIRKKLHGKIK
jgi:uncharacterized protein (UPF0332 family)